MFAAASSSNHDNAVSFLESMYSFEKLGLEPITVDTTLIGDSGYTSTIGSRLPSAHSSRLTSRSVSPEPGQSASTAASSKRSSRRTSRSNSRQTSPKKAPSNQRSRGLPLTLDSGVRVFLDEPGLAADLLLRPLADTELNSARTWLEKLDWGSLTTYQRVQDEILSVEEDFLKSYSQQPPPMNRLEDNDYSDLIRADTLVSLVELAWSAEPDIITTKKTMHILDSPNSSSSSSDEDNHQHNVTVKVCRTKTPLLLNKLNKLERTLEASKEPQPDGVQSLSNKPKREDAMFNIRYKTQSCVHFDKWKNCPAGENCHFAHGLEELRKPKQHPKYKTQVCVHFATTGVCPFGKRCFFDHTIVTSKDIDDPGKMSPSRRLFSV